MKTVDKLKAALIVMTDRSIAKGKGDKKCSSKFFKDVQDTNNKLALECDEEEFDEFAVFSSLVELHIGNDTVSQLNQFLKEWH